MIDKNLRIAFGILLVVASIASVSAVYTQSYLEGPNFIPTTGEQQFPLFDRAMCGAGQDFILQVSPLGCTPSVVRSDLLEEQNYPVFCPITATKINPLVNVEAINRITFTGNFSPEVQGISYLPARAALGQYGAQINQPILNNIGYAVIVLRRQPNETAMPDFVEGDITATIQYDIKNAFGVGDAVFYLPEMSSDQEWQNNFRKYSFWEGRGYLRADSITNTDAVISVYSGRDNFGQGDSQDKRVLASERIDVGETSREIPMPGFDYCLGSMELVLHGLESPDTRARVSVNGDVIELKKGEKFIENKCTVTNVDKQGVVETVSISCSADRESGTRGSFTLGINPKINLSVEGVVGEYKVGDILYQDEESKRNVFLGHIGERRDGERFIILAITQHTSSEAFLRSIDKVLVRDISKVEQDLASSGNLLNAIENEFALLIRVGNAIARGSDFSSPIYEGTVERTSFPFGEFLNKIEKIKNFFTSKGTSVESVYTQKEVGYSGFAGAVDISIGSDSEGYYESAVGEYQTIQSDFSGERWPEEREATLGEDALRAEIATAYTLGKKRTALELCSDFEEIYSGISVPEICSDVRRLSSFELDVQDVIINGKVYKISFEGVREPTFDEYGAYVTVSGTGEYDDTYPLRKGQRVFLSENEWFELDEVRDDRIIIDANVQQAGVRSLFFEQRRFTVMINDYEIVGANSYQIGLNEVNLEKLAKVSVKPQVNFARTEADFNFKIGIEKRLIQLSPEKTRELIGTVNSALQTIKSINEPLGTLVSIGKSACLGLTVKNFFLDLDGRGAARQKVMRAPEVGWFDQCSVAVSGGTGIGNKGPWSSVESCLLDNNDEIEASVDAYAKAIEEQKKSLDTLRSAHTTKGKGLFGEDILNYDAFMTDYVDNVNRGYLSSLSSSLSNAPEEGIIRINNQDVPVSEIISEISSESLTLEQAKNLELNSKLLSSDNSVVRQTAWAQLKRDLGDLWVNSENERTKREGSDLLGGLGLSGMPIEIYESEGSIKGVYKGYRTPSGATGQIPEGIEAAAVIYKGNVYILGLQRAGSKYRVSSVYTENGAILGDATREFEEIQSRFTFEYFDRQTYENRCTNCEVRYYEVGQYAGLPAIVPFDLQNGWYAGIKSTLPLGGSVKPYDDSGKVSSFWLCNVGSNGREEFFSGFGDDSCQQINLDTGRLYYQFEGLDESDTRAKITQARTAIAEASRQHRTGIGDVSLFGQSIRVGSPATGTPEIQCQDFMSPLDCNLLFNVCDPVVCPSSRCDLGGAYPVENVIQSGVAGSLALCLPNYPEVKVPICLSGVHAGLEGYETVLDSYQQCLQTSLETGQTVGICDELHSIYMCEFFWRQGLPIAKFGIQQGLGKAFGSSTKGGGEYLGVQSALQNTENSINFFTQYYADDSFRSFKARSAEGVGGEVCKVWTSVSGGANVLDTLIAPDSPVQFYGRFDEIPFTTATNPPISHYKVFYHVYAGKDFPAYYQVYLKAPGSSFFQDVSFRRDVAQGFIAAGEYESQTFDFTAPSGYQQMCILVNGQEECGFKQVTTDFFFNNITETYIAGQASRTDITSENECVSGTVNIQTLNPLKGGGISEVTDPAIYNQGITRVCSTENPGKGTNPDRWRNVGYCGTQNVGCWLDAESVKNAIKNTNTENAILGEVAPNYTDVFLDEAGYLTESNFNEFVEEVMDEADLMQRITKVNENIGKVFFPNQIGYLHLLKGDFYSDLASLNRPPAQEVTENVTGGAGDTGVGEQEGTGSRNVTSESFQITQESSRIIRGDNVGIGQFVEVPGTDYSVKLVDARIEEPVSGGNSIYSKFEIYRKGTNDPLTCNKIWGVFNQKDLLIIIDVGKPRIETCKNLGVSVQLLSYDDTTKTISMRTISGGQRFEKITKGQFVSLQGTDYFVKVGDINSPLRDTVEATFEFYRKGTNDPLTCNKGFSILLDPDYLKITSNSFPSSFKLCSELNLGIQIESYDFGTGEITFFVRELPGEYGISTYESPIGPPSPGTPSSTVAGTETCSSVDGCQKVVGKEVIKIAQSEKSRLGINDASVLTDTGAKNFECLVLQVARVESGIRHCKEINIEGDPLYCNGNIGEIRSNLQDETSLGIMQINLNDHEEELSERGIDISFVEDNVLYAISLLDDNYNTSIKTYNCDQQIDGSFVLIQYSGWKRSLRAYNGWNKACTNSTGSVIGNPRYVEQVLSDSNRNEVGRLFSEVCG